MNSKVLNYLSEKKDNFMDWFEANKQSIKTNATKVIATGLTLAMLTNVGGCKNSDAPPFINPNAFTGETLPPAIETRPQEEIIETGITAEDVLAIYDQLSLIAIQKFWSSSKEDWGDDFYKINATFSSISTPNETIWNPQKSTHVERSQPYYTYDTLYESPLPWQTPPYSYSELVYPVKFSIDVGFNNNIFTHQSFDGFGIYASQFIPIAHDFGSEQFNLTNEYINSVYEPGSLVHTIHSATAFTPFTITRDDILQITDQDILWNLYNCGVSSLYSINFPEEYSNNTTFDFQP